MTFLFLIKWFGRKVWQLAQKGGSFIAVQDLLHIIILITVNLTVIQDLSQRSHGYVSHSVQAAHEAVNVWVLDYMVGLVDFCLPDFSINGVSYALSSTCFIVSKHRLGDNFTVICFKGALSLNMGLLHWQPLYYQHLLETWLMSSSPQHWWLHWSPPTHWTPSWITTTCR